MICTPVRAPKANAFAERWVRTVRSECLDWTLVLGRQHVECVLRDYMTHYNAERPHRGLGLRAPDPPATKPIGTLGAGRVRRRDVLGGLIHEYRRVA